MGNKVNVFSYNKMDKLKQHARKNFFRFIIVTGILYKIQVFYVSKYLHIMYFVKIYVYIRFMYVKFK